MVNLENYYFMADENSNMQEKFINCVNYCTY